MSLFFTSAGVTAGFGMAAGTDVSDAERKEAIAKSSGFARGKHKADVGECEAQSANELHQLAIGDLRERLELACVRAKARERKGDLGFPAVPQEMLAMICKTDRFAPPVRKAIKRTNSEATKSCRV